MGAPLFCFVQMSTWSGRRPQYEIDFSFNHSSTSTQHLLRVLFVCFHCVFFAPWQSMPNHSDASKENSISIGFPLSPLIFSSKNLIARITPLLAFFGAFSCPFRQNKNTSRSFGWCLTNRKIRFDTDFDKCSVLWTRLSQLCRRRLLVPFHSGLE